MSKKNRLLRTKSFNLCFNDFSEFSTTSGNAVSTSNPMLNRKVDELDLGFMNHNAAFKSKSTWQVFRGYIVYQLCSIGPLVENNEKVNHN